MVYRQNKRVILFLFFVVSFSIWFCSPNKEIIYVDAGCNNKENNLGTDMLNNTLIEPNTSTNSDFPAAPSDTDENLTDSETVDRNNSDKNFDGTNRTTEADTSDLNESETSHTSSSTSDFSDDEVETATNPATNGNIDTENLDTSVPPWVGIASSTEKFFPDSVVPNVKIAAVEAARNEFEPFQVIIAGGENGITLTDVTISDMSNDTANFSTEKTYIYREEFYYVSSPSSLDGFEGYWPDPLIPHVDPYYHEERNAFPLTVPAGEIRVVLIDLYVPPDVQAGTYNGTVSLSFSNQGIEIPVVLRVRDFTLPSTSSLKTTFGMRWDTCVVHLGSYDNCEDSGIEAFDVLYSTVGLDHRITIESVYYYPSDESGWEHFDQVYGPFLDGKTSGILTGARWTTLRSPGNVSADELTRWRAHFEANGWTETTQLFNYTCDEPPAGCNWGEITENGSKTQEAGVPSLVTTDYGTASENGVLDSIDILVPLMNFMRSTTSGTPRSDYDTWLATPSGKQLWWYISCMSHGCGGGCETSTSEWNTNWPSYVIDSSALQARALEWYTFANDIRGELFYAVANRLNTAWEDQCGFSGSGDGNFFYPGTPDRIGGSSHIPIVSLRLKLIREGLEDYEYLYLLEQLGDRDFAAEAASSLFEWHAVNDATIDELMDTRRRIADRIEELN